MKKKNSNPTKRNKEAHIDLDLDNPQLKYELNHLKEENELFKIAAFEELKRFQAQFQSMALLPTYAITEAIKPLIDFQNVYLNQIKEMTELVQKSVYNSGIMQIVSSIQKLQVGAFAGLIINSEIENQVISSKNGLFTTSTIRKAKLTARSEVGINIEKNTTTEVSSGISYRKLETIETKLEILDENMKSLSSKDDLRMIKEKLSKHDNFFDMIQDNPFQFFKIKKVDFVKGYSYFLINGNIKVIIPSKTLQHYICEVLFSGKKDNITDEWFTDEIIHELKSFLGVAEIKRLTWSKLKEAIININEKIAIQTTKQDVITIPRAEIAQLNYEYFSPK